MDSQNRNTSQNRSQYELTVDEVGRPISRRTTDQGSKGAGVDIISRTEARVSAHGDPPPNQTETTIPVAGTNIYAMSHGTREPSRYAKRSHVDTARHIRDFAQGTDLEDATTLGLTLLVSDIRDLAMDFSENSSLHKKNEDTYRSLTEKSANSPDEDDPSIPLELIPSLKAEFADFDGLVDSLIARDMNRPDHIWETAAEVPGPEPHPHPHPSRSHLYKFFAFRGV